MAMHLVAAPRAQLTNRNTVGANGSAAAAAAPEPELGDVLGRIAKSAISGLCVGFLAAWFFVPAKNARFTMLAATGLGGLFGALDGVKNPHTAGVELSSPAQRNNNSTPAKQIIPARRKPGPGTNAGPRWKSRWCY